MPKMPPGPGGPSCSPGQFSHHQSKADFSFLRTGTRRKCHSFRGERRRHRALLRLSSPLLFFPLQGEMPPPFHVPNRFQLSQNYNSGKKERNPSPLSLWSYGVLYYTPLTCTTKVSSFHICESNGIGTKLTCNDCTTGTGVTGLRTGPMPS